MMSGRFRLVADYSLTDWLWSFWNRSMADAAASHGLPFNYPLWFVRDLMMMVLLSPLIYFCVKKLRGFAVALLGLLWMFDIGLGIPGFSTVAFFFFAAGAWFSLSGRNFMQAMRPCLKASAVLYAALALALLCLRDAAWNGYLIRLSIVVGIVLDTADGEGGADPEALETAKLLAEETGATYPFLIPDAGLMNGLLTGVQAVPTSFFVDSDGNLVGNVYTGSRSLEDWTEIVNQELEALEAAQ